MKMKIMAIACVVMLFVAFSAYCGGSSSGNAQPAPGPVDLKAPITITIQGPFGPEDSGIMNDVVSQYIRQKTGITIDLLKQPAGGDAINQTNVQIAANDLPNMFFQNGGATQMLTLIDSKLVWQLDDLVEKYAPNTAKDGWAKAGLLNLKARSPDFGLYSYGTGKGYSGDISQGPPRGYYLRWDLYKKLGYPKITNLKELADVLEQMVKLEPTTKDGLKTYAWGLWNNGYNPSLFQPQHMMKGQFWNSTRLMAGSILTREVEPTNQYKDLNSTNWEMLRWSNDLWRRGILDPDSFTQTLGDYSVRATNGVYMCISTSWDAGGANNLHITAGEPDKRYICLPSQIFGYDTVMLSEYIMAGDRHWSIAKTFKMPERAIQLLDFVGTPEFSRIAHYGMEGMNWNFVNGKPVLTDMYLALSSPDSWKENQQKTGLGLYSAFCGYHPGITHPLGGPIMSPVIKLTEMDKDFIKFYGGGEKMHDIYTKGMKSTKSAVQLTIGVLPEDLRVMEPMLTDFCNKSYVAITRARNDAEFLAEQEKFIKGMDAYKADEIFKTYYNNNKNSEALAKEIYALLGF